MCLAIPGQIIEINDHGDNLFRTATVSFGGVMKDVNLSMLPDVKIDDYILVHVGIALSVIDEDEAKETIRYLTQMGEWSPEGLKTD